MRLYRIKKEEVDIYAVNLTQLATRLQALEARQADVYPRLPGKLEFAPEEAPRTPEVSLFDLLHAVSAPGFGRSAWAP